MRARWSNPSLQPTAYGWLRQPSSAAELKRWAPELVTSMLTLREVLNDFALYAKLEPGVVSVSTQSSSGERPIHWMAALGDVPAIQLLAKAGADLSVQDQSGNTALHVAVSGGHGPAAQALIAAGAAITSRNRLGQTPEDIARSFGSTNLVALFAKS